MSHEPEWQLSLTKLDGPALQPPLDPSIGGTREMDENVLQLRRKIPGSVCESHPVNEMG